MVEPLQMMKALLVLFLSTVILVGETKQETELKKKLADAQAALAAAEARNKSLQTGTQRLTEAVRDATETSKQNGEKVEEVSHKITAVEAAAKSQTKITETATKKLAATVEAQSAHVATVINEQVEQQKRALAAAREAARNLKESNKVLARTAEENRIAKEENAAQLARANKSLDDLNHKAEVLAAANQTAITHDKYELYKQLAGPAVLGALIVVFQLFVAGRQNGKLKEMAGVQKEIHTNTNGALSEAKAAREKAEAEAALLRQQLEYVTGIKPIQDKP